MSIFRIYHSPPPLPDSQSVSQMEQTMHPSFERYQHHVKEATTMWEEHGADKVKVEIQFVLGDGFVIGQKPVLIARLAMLHLMREQAAPAHLGTGVIDGDEHTDVTMFDEVGPIGDNDFKDWTYQSIKFLKTCAKQHIGVRKKHQLIRLAKRKKCGVKNCNPAEGMSKSGLGSIACTGCRVTICPSMHCLNLHINESVGGKVQEDKPLIPHESQGEPGSCKSRGNGKRKEPEEEEEESEGEGGGEESDS